jgi:hypothetical protein
MLRRVLAPRRQAGAAGAAAAAARLGLSRRLCGPSLQIGDVTLPLVRPRNAVLVPTVGAPDDPFASAVHPSTRGWRAGPAAARAGLVFQDSGGAYGPETAGAFDPLGIEDSPETLAHLRWMAQKDILGQDMFLGW